MKIHFKASSTNYIFEIIRGNEIVFYLENALSDEFGHFLSRTITLNSIRNPVAVFREVRRLVLSYVLDNKARYFCFQGDSDRLSLYDKFAKQLQKYGFDYVFHDGRFTFFKENCF